MENTGYCEKHQRTYEIKRVPGSWIYECPECRKEGAYSTYTSTTVKLKPAEEWTTSNRAVEYK